MERDDLLTALRRLRDGRDPATDEPLPAEHPFQRGDVVRLLFAAVEELARASAGAGGPAAAADGAADRPKRARAPNAGQPWREDDDRRLAEAFDGGADERELAAEFGRSRASIRARLIRLGRGALLEAGPAPRYPVGDAAPGSGVEEVSQTAPA